MEVNKTGVLWIYIGLLYRSKNPAEEDDDEDETFDFSKVTFTFVCNRILNEITMPKHPITDKDYHPQYEMLSDAKKYMETSKQKSHFHHVMMFRYFILNLTVISPDLIYCFIKNKPVEYVYFEINGKKHDLTLLANTISNHGGRSFRVRVKTGFGMQMRYGFNLENGIKATTARGDFLVLDAVKCKVKTPTTGFTCMVILRKGNTVRCFYNNAGCKTIHECCFLRIA